MMSYDVITPLDVLVPDDVMPPYKTADDPFPLPSVLSPPNRPPGEGVERRGGGGGEGEEERVRYGRMEGRICNDTEYPAVDDCVVPWYLPFNEHAEVVNGYIMPTLVIVTIATNSLICAVLLKRKMINPSNTILVAMAISDMLTGVWTLPFYLYFYTLGGHKDYVPYEWCVVYAWLIDYLPTVFHTASIWLTVALAAQRYVYVCHNTRSKHFFSIRNMLKIIVIIYLASFAYQLTRVAETTLTPVQIDSYSRPGQKVLGCSLEILPHFKEHQLQIYFNVYFWFRVVFVHILPCTGLVVLNALLGAAMQASKTRMQLLLRQNRRVECRRLKETNATTLLLIVVVAMFLLIEIPVGCFLITMLVENTFNVEVMSRSARATAGLAVNMLTLVSYPFNFFIYCAMSRQFRETCVNLCAIGGGGGEAGEGCRGGGGRREDGEDGEANPLATASTAARYVLAGGLTSDQHENGTKETKV